MIDYHCHLDLYDDPMKIYAEANKRNIEILAVTTSPRAFLRTSQHFTGSPNIRVALGFHPELIAQRPSEKALFFEKMKTTKYLGEIGIDGSLRMKESIFEQKAFFSEVVHAAMVYGGKVLSIHSRGATKEVLQILEKYRGDYIPILHWFTGSIKEAEKAIELGCWFSVNPNMCLTKNGQNVISVIPLDRILPETDAPFTRIKNAPYMPWDTTVMTYMAKMEKKENVDIDMLFQGNLGKLERI